MDAPRALYCGNLDNALAQLRRSLAYLRSPAAADAGLYEQFRAACVQAFEFTYELAVRHIRRQLSEASASPGVADLPFADQMRLAQAAGLVRDQAAFRQYRALRNLTSHTYEEANADLIVAELELFVADVDWLLGALTRAGWHRA